MLTENEQYLIVKETYPHIAAKIEFLWGKPEFNEMLNQMINDTRDGKRQGFPKPVASALFRLSMQHDIEFPQFVKAYNSDIWTMNFKPF